MKKYKITLLIAVLSFGISNVNAQDLKRTLNSAKDNAIETQKARAAETVEELNSKKEALENKVSEASNTDALKDAATSKLSSLGNLTNIASSIQNNDLANKVKTSISSLSNASDKLAMAKSAFDTAKASGLLSSSAIAKKEAQITQITDKIAQIQALIGSTKGL